MSERPPSGEEGGSVPHDGSESAATNGAAADPVHSTTRDPAAPRGDATPATLTGPAAADGAADSGGSEPGATFPWPPAEGESVAGAAARTWRESLFAPATFFRSMPHDATLGPALAYFLAITVVGAGIQLFWGMVALATLPAPGANSPWSLFMPTSARDALVTFLLTPVFTIGLLFIGAAVVHALLKLLRGAGQRFGATVRVFSYAQSAQLFAIVPFVGELIGGVWSIVVTVIGLREAHRTSTARAAAAVLLPIAAIIGFIVFIAFLLILAGVVLMQPPG